MEVREGGRKKGREERKRGRKEREEKEMGTEGQR